MTSRLGVLAIAWITVTAVSPVAAHEPVRGRPLEVGAEVPDFRLGDQDRRTVTLRDLRGRVVLLSFIYTACPDLCPMLVGRLVMIQEALGEDFGRGVVVLSISLDPERDTPPVLRRYAEAHGAKTSGWRFLTGDPRDVKRAVEGLGVWYERTPRGEVRHTGRVLLLDGEGKLRASYADEALGVGQVLADVVELLKGGSRAR